MNDLGKPGAGDRHARIDERGLETEHGLGTAAPATCAWTAPDLSATAPALDSTQQHDPGGGAWTAAR